MGFDKAFHAAATYASPPDIRDFRKHISPEWIEEALRATDTATVRRRRLPAEQVIWVVLGMGCFVIARSKTSSVSLILRYPELGPWPAVQSRRLVNVSAVSQ